MSAEAIQKKFSEAKTKLDEMEREFEKELRRKIEEVQNNAIEKLTKSLS